MICQLKKYIEQLHEEFMKLFKDNPSKDQEIYLEIMKIMIKYEHLNDLSRKGKGKGATHLHSYKMQVTGFYLK